MGLLSLLYYDTRRHLDSQRRAKDRRRRERARRPQRERIHVETDWAKLDKVDKTLDILLGLVVATVILGGLALFVYIFFL